MSLTKICPTKRALDAGDSAAFSGIFLALSFPAPEQNPRPPQRQYRLLQLSSAEIKLF
jgi:hypothetical protein